jgi:hypothetical protein
METNPTPQTNSGTNRNLIISIVIAIVLCCCCAITAVAGYYGYQAYVEAQKVVQDIQDFEIPTPIPGDPFDPTQPTPSFDLGNDIPEGGLADDETRLTAWFSLQIVAMISGCETPTVQGTTITVIQQPDASGVWREEWNVNCGDGTSKPFQITFTPENGFVNVSVEMPGQ